MRKTTPPLKDEWEHILDDFLEIKWKLPNTIRKHFIETVRTVSTPTADIEIFTCLKINRELWIPGENEVIQTLRIFQMGENQEGSIYTINL